MTGISARLCGFIQDHNSGLRTWPKKWRIQWGRWDCKSKEMTVGIVCHVEFLKLNQEAIVWKIILPDCLAGVCHYARPDWLWRLSGQVIPSREVV